LQREYSIFSEKFGPSTIKSLDGEMLLETLFNFGNRGSLVYWLEFKNDDEFQTIQYGSISGGSSYKFIMFKRNSDGAWVTGNGMNPVEMTVDEAIQLARKIRDNLVLGAELIGKLPEEPSEEDYIHLQLELNQKLTLNMHDFRLGT
jgi:5-methylcytosine-specific restriction enzyme B